MRRLKKLFKNIMLKSKIFLRKESNFKKEKKNTTILLNLIR